MIRGVNDMKLIKNFMIVIANLVGELWIGYFRKANFYDNYTITKTKLGYTFLISIIVLTLIGVFYLLKYIL